MPFRAADFKSAVSTDSTIIPRAVLFYLFCGEAPCCFSFGRWAYEYDEFDKPLGGSPCATMESPQIPRLRAFDLYNPGFPRSAHAPTDTPTTNRSSPPALPHTPKHPSPRPAESLRPRARPRVAAACRVSRGVPQARRPTNAPRLMPVHNNLSMRQTRAAHMFYVTRRRYRGDHRRRSGHGAQLRNFGKRRERPQYLRNHRARGSRSLATWRTRPARSR